MNKFSCKSQNKFGDYMEIFFIKCEKESKEYKIPKLLGMNIENIKNPEDIDKKIEEINIKGNSTIVISSELASFSDNIIKKYKNDKNINIIITP